MENNNYPQMTGALEALVSILVGYLQGINESPGSAEFLSKRALDMHDHIKKEVLDKIAMEE